MTPIKLAVEITPPHDGSRWRARAEILNHARYYIGTADGDSVASAFNDALLVAFGTGFDPEEECVS